MSSNNTKQLLFQLLFGIDTTIAIAACSTLGFAISVDGRIIERVGYLAFAGFCSYLPDLDLLIFFPLRKRYGWTNHWVVGHHPSIVIPIAILMTFSSATMLELEERMFLTLLSAICITGHFIHDSIDECGLHWLSPFNWTHVSLQHGWPRLVDRLRFERRAIEEARRMNHGGIDDKLAIMSESISKRQIVLWCVATIELIVWLVM